MVETTSVREEKPKLSARDRLCLIQTINALPPTQFNELVFALDPPKGVISSSAAAQGTRSKELLDWLEGSSGPGLVVADEVLQVLIPQATKTAPQPVAFVMMGRMGDLTPSELEAIVELLRQKTGDDSISLAFSREGSIKLILNGSPEGLAKLQDMFEAGELEQLNIPHIEAVAPVEPNTQDARKARLIQVFKLRGRSSRTQKVAARARDLDLALANALDLARGLGSTPALSDALDLARARALVLALDLTNAHDRAIALELAGALDHDQTHALALDFDRVLALARTLEFNFALDLDFSSADLSGANLRDINLTGVDLTGADLTHADVTGTIFRDNLGLTEADKQDLRSRGAIFLDPPSSDVPALALR